MTQKASELRQNKEWSYKQTQRAGVWGPIIWCFYVSNP